MPIYDARKETLTISQYESLPLYEDFSDLGNDKTVIVIFTASTYTYKNRKAVYIQKQLKTSLSLNILAVIVVADKSLDELDTSGFPAFRRNGEWQYLGIDLKTIPENNEGSNDSDTDENQQTLQHTRNGESNDETVCINQNQAAA